MKADPSAPSPTGDALYPSFSQPSNGANQYPPVAQPQYGTHPNASVPVAEPVYHYSQSQYLPPNQHPLNPPVAAMYVPPPHSGDYRDEGYCGFTFKLMVFHLMNAILGIGAFSLVTAGLSMSISLVPLCCFGLVIFRVLLHVVRFLAQIDVELYNYISPPGEHVYLSIPERATTYGMEGRRLAASLSSVSPLSLMATIYFLTIKFALGILSCIVVTLAIALPVVEIIGATIDPEDMVINDGDFEHSLHFDTDPFGFVLASVCIFVISLALMHLTARLSRKATRFFCCERFSTYRYVYAPQYSNVQYPMATAAYGSTATYT
ncbi:hypothetical protein Poli38472_003146 [Pythium oligandrum]|uniref:Uncharacterized protein n=1 Tax=Pythium oligandrum TaxID=41045 RepID=A0A8K1C6B1_PYTOL|nr:hypothetical protein Poli38472_003146 [Pythium oligandrum]|eukprot:TMW57221.1 hypothetical protein Poli38472_003146 [Pythium oligandrum]